MKIVLDSKRNRISQTKTFIVRTKNMLWVLKRTILNEMVFLTIKYI